MEKQKFGDWLRWTIARRGIDRAALAARLKCSAKTITNLYARETPDGVTDVFISRLADLLDMTEPELLVKWREGLPAKAIVKPATGKKSK